MNCDFYRQHELGKIADADFERHADDCEECKKLIELDARLLAEAKSLKQTISAPLLWAKIENSLRAEKQVKQRKWAEVFQVRTSLVWRLAAVLILAVGVGAYFFIRPESSSPRLLAGAALKQVEEKEREYEDAITKMEGLAESQLEKFDEDLILLYRDRLATIDAQIVRCKEAAAHNPANAHIRRYLLAALQDKQETLKEMAEYRPSRL